MINADRRLEWQNEQACPLPSARIPVPMIIKAAALMWLSLFLVAASPVLTSRSAGVRFDPFADYADVLPGQPWANTEAYGTECSSYRHISENDEGACSWRPAAGIFSRISVVRYHSIIDSITFTPRENALTLGHVALTLGAPPRKPSNSWILDGYRVSVWLVAGRVSYFRSVQGVYLAYHPSSEFGHEQAASTRVPGAHTRVLLSRPLCTPGHHLFMSCQHCRHCLEEENAHG